MTPWDKRVERTVSPFVRNSRTSNFPLAFLADSCLLISTTVFYNSATPKRDIFIDL